MEIKLEPGKYVVAVSGGLDSVVLLDLLSNTPGISLVVAHFDHGIRKDSDEDRKFVSNLAEKYGYEFYCRREELGENASEELARERRYEFLESVKSQNASKAIITAHHKDDLIETALINLYRGTGRRGITSLESGKIIRPLLGFSKKQLIDYAKDNGLEWREDSTNQDEKYLRNKIRKLLVSEEAVFKNQLFGIINNTKVLNHAIDELLQKVFQYGYDLESRAFSRKFFNLLPYKVSCEVVAYWLRFNKLSLERKRLEDLVVSLKTGLPNSSYDIHSGYTFQLSKEDISLEAPKSV